ASITGHPAGPGRVGVSVCDIATGTMAHAAVLEALIERGITGEGKAIGISLFDAMADWMNVPLLYFEGTGKAPQRLGLAHPSICPYGAFATSDGALVLISIQNEREWQQFCAGFLQEPELPQRDGFRSNVERVAHRPDVDAHVAAVFATLTRDECAQRLRGANIAYGFVNDLPALAAHPALRRLVVQTPNGEVAMAAPAARLDGPPRGYGPVPALGAQTAAVRAEFSGG
ncbi:CoA transferase, partial [Teichococcus deserti]|uniref:CoA transferase n=1 Tax=Teichococcus deserti TaxID=1817963 RepID=UPI001056C8B5